MVEDDMIFSSDFAFYFEQLAVLLDMYNLSVLPSHKSAF